MTSSLNVHNSHQLFFDFSFPAILTDFLAIATCYFYFSYFLIYFDYFRRLYSHTQPRPFHFILETKSSMNTEMLIGFIVGGIILIIIVVVVVVVLLTKRKKTSKELSATYLENENESFLIDDVSGIKTMY